MRVSKIKNEWLKFDVWVCSLAPLDIRRETINIEALDSMASSLLLYVHTYFPKIQSWRLC
jgi:hypothetical protein